MLHHSKLQILILCIVFILVSPLSTLAQQTDDGQNTISLPLVYACIDPDGDVPYLLTLRDADMTDHIVGFVVPKKASVTIYSAESNVAIGVYSIAPDAQSGGYRRTGVVAKAYARDDIPASERMCSSQYPTVVTENLHSTIPLPVSEAQAVIIQLGGDNLLDTAEFRGAFTFHFRPESGESREDIQIIQLSGGGIEISFPYITENTRLILIANKDFRLRISFSQQPNDFLAQAIANPTEGFSESLIRQSVNTDPPTALDLFKIMNEGAVRIFPAFGIVETYPTGGFLRLEMTPVPASRDTQFVSGQTITAIAGAEPTYDRPDGTPGTLNKGDKAEVVDVNKDGQLIVKSSKVGQGTIIDAWLVEVSIAP